MVWCSAWGGCAAGAIKNAARGGAEEEVAHRNVRVGRVRILRCEQEGNHNNAQGQQA